MKNPKPRRQALLESMADHVLEQGLQGLSLRPLAAAVGTSDRMLLYYFAGKDELVAAVLGLLGQRIETLLSSSLPAAQPYDLLLPRVCELMRSPAVKPYMQLWLELAALAARGTQPFAAVSLQLSTGFLAWTASRLELENEADRAAQSALLFATVEGLILLDALGRADVVANALQARR